MRLGVTPEMTIVNMLDISFQLKEMEITLVSLHLCLLVYAMFTGLLEELLNVFVGLLETGIWDPF